MEIKEHIFFLGIGGIGMSALARYYNICGARISGYDRSSSELTSELEREGMQIQYSDDISLLPDNIDRVVFTPAIAKDNNIYQHFVQLGTPMSKRSAVLGKLTSDFNNIAIAGTHGKTTTSAILSHILAYTNKSFTAFLGGIATNYNTNFITTGNEWMIEEADEYDQSFLQLHPNLAIITSMDADHLDIYGDRETMKTGYYQFASKIKEGGLLLVSNNLTQEELKGFRNYIHPTVRIRSYGFDSAEVQCMLKEIENAWFEFQYKDDLGNQLEQLSIRLPGKHNIQNATAAIRMAIELGLEEFEIRESLLSFKGVKRRFELLHEGEQILIDDYAHHPEELKAAIDALRACYPGRKILGIFQPHLYSRTRDFASEFANELDALDEVILVELYPAREKPIHGIDSNTILHLMHNKNKSFVLKSNLIEELKGRDLDIVILLGAGDLTVMQNEIIKILR